MTSGLPRPSNWFIFAALVGSEGFAKTSRMKRMLALVFASAGRALVDAATHIVRYDRGSVGLHDTDASGAGGGRHAAFA